MVTEFRSVCDRAVVLRLDQIRIDGGTQARAETNQKVVLEYMDLMLDGVTFPPV